jgi:hypothetical protein
MLLPDEKISTSRDTGIRVNPLPTTTPGAPSHPAALQLHKRKYAWVISQSLTSLEYQNSTMYQ